MRVLLTNHRLIRRSGTELWIRDVATALLRRGHDPVAYSRQLGEVGAELRATTVPVLSDLDRLARAPDIIHAQHHLEAMTAIARFPKTPAIFVCHGWLPTEEAPPDHPRILRYVAVDELVRQRLVDECGIDPSRMDLLPNFVDLDRFVRRPPLPNVPSKALVFSNYMTDETALPAVHRACEELGLSLEVIGREAGRPVVDPEHHLGQFDIVFAKGRAALEAAAVGAAVVVCDRAGLGPLVTPDNLDVVRTFNFGVRLLRDTPTVAAVGARLRAYDATEASMVTDRVRQEASLETAVDRLISLYEDVRREWASATVAADDEARAMARYLRHGPLTAGSFLQPEVDRLRATAISHREHLREATAELDRLRGEAESRDAQIQHAGKELAAAHDERCHLVERLTELEEEIVTARAALREAEAGHSDQLAAFRSQLDNTRSDLDRSRSSLDHERRQASARLTELESLAALTGGELEWIQRSLTWRVRERLLSVPGLQRLYRGLGSGEADRSPLVDGAAMSKSGAESPIDDQTARGVQTRAEAMFDEHGFLGVPRQTFEVGGAAQLARLLEHGLTPDAKVLDIGCGCLRVAYWLIHFLDADGYRGIEPAQERVEIGQRHLMSQKELRSKRPRFDHNHRFDTSVFGERFDFFLAGSIWTHCSKPQIETTLDGFLRDTGPDGVFLVSYLPAEHPDDDYLGDTWVGTSHESDVPGVIRHDRAWIEDACRARELAVSDLPGLDCDHQLWLRIDKRRPGHNLSE